MEFSRDLFILLGRVFISAMFLWVSYEKLKNWSAAQTYFKSKNVPQVSIALPVSVVAQIVGALSILLGWHAHLGAFLLLIVTVLSSLWLHAFWKVQGNERNLERMLFMKDLAIVGGLLLVLAVGAGHWEM